MLRKLYQETQTQLIIVTDNCSIELHFANGYKKKQSNIRFHFTILSDHIEVTTSWIPQLFWDLSSPASTYFKNLMDVGLSLAIPRLLVLPGVSTYVTKISIAYLSQFRRNSKTWILIHFSRYVSRVVIQHKNSFQYLATFFMSTRPEDSKNMQEIEFSRWFFELPAK